MVTKRYCDKCGKEPKEISGIFMLGNNDQIDLCPSCEKKTVKFIRGGK